MKTLAIDIETYSSADLKKTGVYKYCESPDFEILLFGYSVDGGPVQVIDLANGEQLPEEIINALTDPSVIKSAFNANFERVCLSQWMKTHGHALHNEAYAKPGDHTSGYLDPSSWHCTMVWSAYLGLPLSLAGVSAVLGLEQQKLATGKDLIRYFCKPCRPTKVNGGRTRNLPHDSSIKWAQFVDYNERDVLTETLIQKRLSAFPVPDEIWQQYHQDQEINDRGIMIDKTLVDSAIRLDTLSHLELTEKMRKLTKVENPASVLQMKRWFAEHGMEIESLGKKQVTDLLKTSPESLRDVLSLRLQLAKSSVKKYQVMQSCVCADSRARGMFQFYGAVRTGRFAGRLVQLQNLTQNHLPDLDPARELVRLGDYETLQMLYGSIPDVLSELVRTAFIAPQGKQFYVADFSAIEARVIAWLANEEWRKEVFRTGVDIYCASASAMFHVPVKKNGVNGHLRQKGKIAELALGYGGSVGALKAMGALEMGLSEDELSPLVAAWRESNPNIVKLWWDIDTAAMKAVTDKSACETHSIRFTYRSGMLFVRLPSGRELAYVKPMIGTNKYNSPSLTYLGTGISKKWERIETYGPKLCENIVQAIARDILCYALNTLHGYQICGHVHDEVIIEADTGTSLDEICELMGTTPPWAKGLILHAVGYVTPFYKKD